MTASPEAARLERYLDFDAVNRPYLEWQLEQFGDAIGQRVLEVGVGVGGILELLADRERLVGIEVEAEVLGHARQRLAGRPNVRLLHADVSRLDDVTHRELREERFDTIVCINVLEHVRDDVAALRVMASLLQPGGRICLLVPAHPALYGAYDRLDGHWRRYRRRDVADRLREAGFEVERLGYFNAVGAIGWLVQYRLLGRTSHGEGELSQMNRLLPALRWIERRVVVPFGLSVVAVARTPHQDDPTPEQRSATAGEREIREAREREFFDRHYGGATAHPLGETLRYRRDLREVLRASAGRPLGRVLSIGCGRGEFERLLAPHADSVRGIDLSPEAIQQAREAAAREGLSNVEFVCSSAEDLAGEAAWDTIVCLAFLHHLPAATLPGFLRRMAELLVDGGLLYAQDPNVGSALRVLGRRVLGARYDAFHSPDERELDPAELGELLSSTGFTEVRTRGTDWGLIPLSYLLRHAPHLVLHGVSALDGALAAVPSLTRWASGFSVAARRGRRSAGPPSATAGR